MRQSSGALDPRSALTELGGVGSVRRERLARHGLACVRDLLLMMPLRLERSSGRRTCAEASRLLGEHVEVEGLLECIVVRGFGKRASVRARLRDASGSLDVFYFRQPWMAKRLRERSVAAVVLTGRIFATKIGPALVAPRFADPSAAAAVPGSLRPLYPALDGIPRELLGALARRALERSGHLLEDRLGESAAELGLPQLAPAMRELHEPSSEMEHARAKRRVALERWLELQAELELERQEAPIGRARAFALESAQARALFAVRGLVATHAQTRVLDEIFGDLASGTPMRRLLQGDVGSGKTLVFAAALLAVAQAGGQAALLAPTTLLAEQHATLLAELFEGRGVPTRLLSSATSSALRARILAALARGEPGVLVGTHALLGDEVVLPRLDLAVIDEQQRFGVAQRRALLAKGRDVHVLLATATPIPRTLARALFGAISTSLLDEKPPGRRPVTTRVLDLDARPTVLAELRVCLDGGGRAYWITPRIGEDDGEDELAHGAAERTFAELSSGPLAPHGVLLVHGGLHKKERSEALDRFRRGQARLLIGTTVLEVGLDVPEATFLVVEGAERLGLAQLHQLRGRVGRGEAASTCYLLAVAGARERLAILERVDDGFQIAAEDLRRRGMGHLRGLRQAGFEAEGLESLVFDAELALAARALLVDDPGLALRFAAPGLRPPSGSEPDAARCRCSQADAP